MILGQVRIEERQMTFCSPAGNTWDFFCSLAFLKTVVVYDVSQVHIHHTNFTIMMLNLATDRMEEEVEEEEEVGEGCLGRRKHLIRWNLQLYLMAEMSLEGILNTFF